MIPKPTQINAAMKTFIPIALISASFTIPMVHAQTGTTTPVGYETLQLNAGLNYVSVRLHESSTTAGELVSSSGTTLTVQDGVADALMSGTTYILEITSGTDDVLGLITEISSWDPTNDEIVTDADLTLFTGFTGSENFNIRPVSTIASVFGPNNEIGLQASVSFATADQILFFNGAGFDKYFYNPGGGFGQTAGWKDESGSDINPEDIEISYSESFIILSQQGDDITISGELKVSPTQLPVFNGINYLGTVYPVGDPLQTENPDTIASLFGSGNVSGFNESVSIATADQILIPNGAGFDKYFYNPGGGFGQTEGWKDEDGNDIDPSSIILTPGILVSSPDSNKNISLILPDAISNL